MNRHNRRSYLAPPAPRSLNRDGSSESMIDNPGETNGVSQTTTTSNMATPTSPISGSGGDTYSSQASSTPTATMSEIPVIATHLGLPSQPSSQTRLAGMTTRSPPSPLSLEHLSLETPDKDFHSSRTTTNTTSSRSNLNRFGLSNSPAISTGGTGAMQNNRDDVPEPASAIEPSSSSRPFFPPRMNSASNVSSAGFTPAYSPRNGLHSATMPRRKAPPPASGPPTGPLPVPPGQEAIGAATGGGSAGAGFGSPRRQR
jgi:mitogen-activated protein kinase kinase